LTFYISLIIKTVIRCNLSPHLNYENRSHRCRRLGICFALLCEQAGYDVLVSDVREDYVKNLRNKFISTNEPEVSKLLSTSPRLSATNSNSKVIRECDIIYTLVATPSKRDGSYDVSAVWDVVQDIKKVKKVQGKAFVVGCTTNPGDCKEFENELDKSGCRCIL
jgi:UDPglucose 6-dehydrogenase